MTFRSLVCAGLRRVMVGATMVSFALISALTSSQATTNESYGDPALSRQVTEATIRARDGRKLNAVISMPDVSKAGPFPVVINVHGGNGDRRIPFLRRFVETSDKASIVHALNTRPWIIIAPGYRADWLGAEEQDVVDVVKFAAKLPGADPTRIVLVGHSNGGRLVLRAASLVPESVKCLISSSPFMTDPSEFLAGDLSKKPWTEVSPAAFAVTSEIRNALRPQVEAMATREGISFDEALARRSVKKEASSINAPVLMFTSNRDETVPAVFVEGTINALNRAGKSLEVVRLQESDHGFFWFRDRDPDARLQRQLKTQAQRLEEEQVLKRSLEFIDECMR